MRLATLSGYPARAGHCVHSTNLIEVDIVSCVRSSHARGRRKNVTVLFSFLAFVPEFLSDFSCAVNLDF